MGNGGYRAVRGNQGPVLSITCVLRVFIALSFSNFSNEVITPLKTR